MKKEMPPREPLFARRSGLISCIVFIVVSALGFFLDRILASEGVPRFEMLLLTNSVTGLFAGVLVYQLAREEKATRDLMRERMQTVAELNHHIRNALQVIKFLGGQQGPALNTLQLQLINDSVERIEWALREVLPKYPTSPAPVPGVGTQGRTIGPAA